jgi:flagellar protein FlbD
VIAVTCRNGEHFSVDPLHIERVETDPDTVVHLVDGTKYVVDQSFDDLLRAISDHRASVLVAQKHLAGGVAELAEHARRASLRVERRARSRNTDFSPGAVPPGDDEG